MTGSSRTGGDNNVALVNADCRMGICNMTYFSLLLALSFVLVAVVVSVKEDLGLNGPLIGLFVLLFN